MKRLVVSLSLFALLPGCVTKGTYEALKNEHETTTAQLTKENQELKATLARDQARLKVMEQNFANTVKDKSQLEGNVDRMRKLVDELAKRNVETEKRIAEYKDLLGKFKAMIDAGQLQVKIVEGRMVVVLPTDVLFASGSARLSDAGKSAVADVTKLLITIADRKFQVEGHTDNIPIKTERFANNWELAAARALTVQKTMLDAGMPPVRVSAASYGESKPAQSNDTKEGKAANRRIEIAVVPDLSTMPGFEELSNIQSATATPTQAPAGVPAAPATAPAVKPK